MAISLRCLGWPEHGVALPCRAAVAMPPPDLLFLRESLSAYVKLFTTCCSLEEGDSSYYAIPVHLTIFGRLSLKTFFFAAA